MKIYIFTLVGFCYICVCKFMKRTREKQGEQDEEEVRSQLFDSEVQNSPLKVLRQIFNVF